MVVIKKGISVHGGHTEGFLFLLQQRHLTMVMLQGLVIVIQINGVAVSVWMLPRLPVHFLDWSRLYQTRFGKYCHPNHKNANKVTEHLTVVDNIVANKACNKYMNMNKLLHTWFLASHGCPCAAATLKSLPMRVAYFCCGLSGSHHHYCWHLALSIIFLWWPWQC